jgi:acetylornithine deacetylase/succinyl-diaminopimelate desuccinylase-like protein
MGEEIGSPGLRAVCERERKALAADVLIASDGPRLSASRPTIFLGSRGAFNFELRVDLREGAHHSGNWGGLLSIMTGIFADLGADDFPGGPIRPKRGSARERKEIQCKSKRVSRPWV